MATAIYLTVSIVLLTGLFLIHTYTERSRRVRLRRGTLKPLKGMLRRGWSFDPPEHEEEAPGATIRTASNSRGWR